MINRQMPGRRNASAALPKRPPTELHDCSYPRVGMKHCRPPWKREQRPHERHAHTLGRDAAAYAAHVANLARNFGVGVRMDLAHSWPVPMRLDVKPIIRSSQGANGLARPARKKGRRVMKEGGNLHRRYRRPLTS